MTMRNMLTLFVLFVLGCDAAVLEQQRERMEITYPPLDFVRDAALARDLAACTEKGGVLRNLDTWFCNVPTPDGGKSCRGYWECDFPTRDGGKPCRDSSECESRCLSTEWRRKVGIETIGACDPRQVLGGCYQYVINGITGVTLCD